MSKHFNDNLNWSADSSITKIDELLKWILANKDQIKTNNSKLKFDFVSYRGSISRILVTPYVNENWIIGASIYKDTIYFCKFDLKEENDYPDSNLLSYAGHNFENMITYSKNKFSNNDSNLVRQYACLIDAKLKTPADSISMLLSAEMDCLDHNKNDSSSLKNFIEIKTAALKYGRWNRLCQNKSAKWWAQSYLAGIPKIVCGLKTKDLRVKKIMNICVNDLSNQNIWDHHICLDFLYKFLVYVKFILSKEKDPSVVYLFDNFTIPSSITCRKLLSNENIRFLHQWYIDKFDE